MTPDDPYIHIVCPNCALALASIHPLQALPFSMQCPRCGAIIQATISFSQATGTTAPNSPAPTPPRTPFFADGMYPEERTPVPQPFYDALKDDDVQL